MNFLQPKANRIPLVATTAGILGGILFFLRFGYSTLNPGKVGWLLGMSDTAFSQLSWTFFRGEPWHWPPGAVTTYMTPAGTTIGGTDSLPLLAFSFKAISFFLPAAFQYAGLWLLISHVLMAVFAVKVAGLFWRSILPRFLAAGLLVLCPAWLTRDGHYALSSHWVLLAALYLYLKPAPEDNARPCLRWWPLMGVAALIHPYPAVLAFLILTADQARRWIVTRETSPLQAATTLGVSGIILLALWSLAGFLRPGHFPIGNLTDDALWSAGFHALWDGQGRTLLTPALPLGLHDPFEGFVYLGAGGLLAAVAVLALGGRGLRPQLARHWPLALVLTLCAAYAFGPRTDLGDQLFRAQARFLWPVFYVLMAAAIAALGRWKQGRWPGILLAAILVIQVIDLAPLLDRRPEYENRSFTTRLKDPQWARAMDNSDLLLVYPSATATTVFENDFVDLALLAHEAQVPTTAGFASRSYLDNITTANDLVLEFLSGPDPDPRTVCVLRRSHFADLYSTFQDNIRCTDLDGFPVCFAREGGYLPDQEYEVTPVLLSRFLTENIDLTLVLVGKGDASRALTQDAVALLSGQGSRIAQLPPDASYACILVRGTPVFEQMNPDSAIEVTAEKNSALGPVRTRRTMSVTSSGTDAGAYASLIVGGREVLLNQVGLNVAVLDDGQNVLAVGTFSHPDDLPEQAGQTGGLVFTLGSARK